MPFAVPRPLLLGQTVSGETRLSLWVKSYVARPKVYLQIGNKLLYADAKPGAHSIEIDTRALPVGTQKITVYLFDDNNRFIDSAVTTVRVSRSAAGRGGAILPTEPLPISGRVTGFLSDKFGLVNAVQIDAGDQVLAVSFSPLQAAQLMPKLPLGAQVDLQVQAHTNHAADGWDLRAIGEEPVATENVPVMFSAPADAQTLDVRGQLTQIVTDFGGSTRALILDTGDVLQFPVGPESAAPTENAKIGWKRGAKIEAKVRPIAAPEGTISDVLNRWEIQALQVDGVEIIGANGALLADAASWVWQPRAYNFPLRVTRGESTAVEPLVPADSALRPW